MQADPLQPAAKPDITPPPSHCRLRYELTPDGITIRSVPPPPTAAIAISILIAFIPSATWIVAYAHRSKPPFITFFTLIIIAVALTLLAASSLIAFLRRLSSPPTWHVTPGELTPTRPGTPFRKRFRFGRSEIVTVRSDDANLHVITQQAGQWRTHSFPLLTTGGGWLAELIAGTFAMEEAETTWTPQSPRSMGPR